MDQKQLQYIFDSYALGKVENFFRNSAWFINKVYTINNSLILKIYTSEDPLALEKETYCYTKFKDLLPVPELLVSDGSKTFCPYSFLIASKLPGKNLYSVWHLLNDLERKEMIKQLCVFLKRVHQLPYDDFMTKFPSSYDGEWGKQIISKIEASLNLCLKKSSIPQTLATDIGHFLKIHQDKLVKQNIWLVHRDIHFDNILVEKWNITGMIDFERIIVGSCDFILSMIKRMSLFPTKYMSEADEPYAKKEDYARLLEWFEAYYPELFDFEELAIRLACYDIEYQLRSVIYHPEEQSIIHSLADILRV